MIIINEACKSILNNAIEKDGVIGDSSQIGTLKEKLFMPLLRTM